MIFANGFKNWSGFLNCQKTNRMSCCWHIFWIPMCWNPLDGKGPMTEKGK